VCVPVWFQELGRGVVAFEGNINVCVFEEVGNFPDLW
jgi:hypothetical protein